MSQAPQTVDPKPFGKYLLLERVAVGGMAEIYLALERTEHAGSRFVTIKRIRPDLFSDAEYREFFMNEGKVSVLCSHPNLPQVFEVGCIGEHLYLAMEYIRGHTLLAALRAAANDEKQLSVATSVAIGSAVAAALEHAHSLTDVTGKPLSVIHRDVTPQNVMIASSGAIKLIDFGIVRSAVQTHKTQAGVVKGKFSYMAPESIAGGGVNQRADLWSLGVVMYESLSGRPLFRGQHEGETMERIRTAPIPFLSTYRADVPMVIEAVIRRALERDPERRFQSASDFLEALDRAAEHSKLTVSTTQVRREISKLCGEAHRPTVDASIVGQAEESAASETAQALDDADHTPRIKERRKSESGRRRTSTGTSRGGGIAADPDLQYFLKMACVTEAGSSTRPGQAMDSLLGDSDS